MSQTVRIHSLIVEAYSHLESGQNAIALWYWLRSIDANGTGKVTFTISQAAAGLDRSIVTVKRYLRQGVALGLFRRIKKSAKEITVYLSSRDNVAMRLGLMSWGATGDVEIDRLRDLRSASTDIATAALQKSSIYLAKKGLKKRDRQNVITPDALPSCSSSQRENVEYIGRRCLFVGEDAILTGVSQVGVANYLDRTDRTIRRRLSNSYRDRHRLQAVDRRQIVQSKLEHEQTRLEQESLFFSPPRLFACKGKTYKAHCNLYDLSAIELVSGRVAKARYRNKVEDLINKEN